MSDDFYITNLNHVLCLCNVYLYDHLPLRFLLILFTDFIAFEWGCGYHESEGAASDGPIWQPGAAGSQHNNHSSQPPWSWSGTCTVLYCIVLYCTVLYLPTTWRLPSLVMARAVLIWHMYWPSSLRSTSRMCRFHTLCPSCDTPIRGFLGGGGVNKI